MHADDKWRIQEALIGQGIEAEVSLVENGTKIHIEIGTVAGNSHYWLSGFLKALEVTGFPFNTNVPLPY